MIPNREPVIRRRKRPISLLDQKVKRRKFIAAYKEGTSYATMSKSFGMSIAMCKYYKRKLGLTPRPIGYQHPKKRVRAVILKVEGDQ